jgi:hypothetical protein
MSHKPNPADFTFDGTLQQPKYDNAVRAWEKMEGMEDDELEKAALVKVGQYFKYPFSSSCKEAVDLFKAGAEWQKNRDKPFSMGICKKCEKEPAIKDYNGHGHYVCDVCYNRLNDYFEQEYN